ncbi:hypothetical protein Scep_016087 [Stephania cephalantha]|uniref:Uncharacterized protein n=1 Tax=Stephania cephalantha TaxID=152367 RepID=A0AAP0ILY7_9MAGN
MMIINALLRNKRFCYVANCNFWREEQRSVSICQGIRRELSRVAVLESLEEVLVLYLFDMFGVAERGFVGKPDCLYIGSSEGLGGGTHFPNEEARTDQTSGQIRWIKMTEFETESFIVALQIPRAREHLFSLPCMKHLVLLSSRQ